MVGRSHGIHAEPTTFGMALASHLAEMKRGRQRFSAARQEVAVGKIAGAVGTYAHLSPAIEKDTLSKMGLEPETVVAAPQENPELVDMTRRFRVSAQKILDRSDTDPPSLQVTEFVPVGTMVVVNGLTEPGATLWVDNEKIDILDDGSFSTVVKLRRDGLNDVRFVAQDSAGNETEMIKSAYVEVD